MKEKEFREKNLRFGSYVEQQLGWIFYGSVMKDRYLRNRLLLLSGKESEFVVLITNHVFHFTVPFHYTEFQELFFTKRSLIHVYVVCSRSIGP